MHTFKLKTKTTKFPDENFHKHFSIQNTSRVQMVKVLIQPCPCIIPLCEPHVLAHSIKCTFPRTHSLSFQTYIQQLVTVMYYIILYLFVKLPFNWIDYVQGALGSEMVQIDIPIDEPIIVRAPLYFERLFSTLSKYDNR